MLGLPPIYDELYQVMAAASWWRDGNFSILDGAYERASLFSMLIAASFELSGGSSVAAARFLPAAVPGALLVALLTVWTRMVAGPIAAAVTLVFLLCWPSGIQLSQYVRFYALQGLVFILGALLVYAAATGTRSLALRAVLAGASLPLFLLGAQLQLTTLVGMMGIGIWVTITFLPTILRVEPRAWWGVGAAVLIGIVGLVVFQREVLWLWQTYNWEPWPRSNDVTFYNRYMRDTYPTFWSLFPVAALIALAHRPRLASFCLAIFVTSIVLQSFGGLKNVRYIYISMPFFFVTWGIAAAAVLPVMWRWLKQVAEQAAGAFLGPRLAWSAAIALSLVSALWIFVANVGFERAVNHAFGRPEAILLDKRRIVWDDPKTTLAPWLEDGAVVVTPVEMIAVAYLGDFDIAFNRPRFSELQNLFGDDIEEFYLDYRTGRPMIWRGRTMERIVECVPVGVLVAGANLVASSDGAAFRIAVAASRVGAETVAGTEGGMSFIAWRHRDREVPAEACADLPDKLSYGAAESILKGFEPRF
ncbi:MAG: hypothetical protein AAFV86_15635 [Pseudomonadota bacterium]